MASYVLCGVQTCLLVKITTRIKLHFPTELHVSQKVERIFFPMIENRRMMQRGINVGIEVSYMKKLIPEPLKRQWTWSQEQESKFGVLCLTWWCTQNIPNHNMRGNLVICKFPTSSRWEPFGKSVATIR